jgi:hypothetical protein
MGEQVISLGGGVGNIGELEGNLEKLRRKMHLP